MGLLQGLSLAGLLAAPALAQERSTVEYSYDRRFEVLGLVQRLAGLQAGGKPVPRYAEDADDVFEAHKSHPAVDAYAAVAGANGGEDRWVGMAAVYRGEPPAFADLGGKDAPRDPVLRLGGEDGAGALFRKLGEFSEQTPFKSFYKKHRKTYDDYEQVVRAAVSGKNGLPRLEDYTGPLGARITIVLPLAYRSRSLAQVLSSKDGTRLVVVADRGDLFRSDGKYSAAPLLGGLVHLAAARGVAAHADAVAASTRAGDRAECRSPWPECSAQLIADAVAERIELRQPASSDTARGRVIQELAGTLLEYEKDRARFPTLLSFFPRLLEALARAP